jgi:hypothetical protein
VKHLKNFQLKPHPYLKYLFTFLLQSGAVQPGGLTIAGTDQFGQPMAHILGIL